MTREPEETPDGPDAPAGPAPEPDSPDDLRLIVGLGNPGKPYDGTRHNVGFDVVRRLAEKLGPGEERTVGMSFLWATRRGPTPLWLLLPMTYMNRSGPEVRRCAWSGNVPPRRVLVVCDDLNLPLAKIRLRRKGSPGGHNGLHSVSLALNTEGFPRLRLGIGEPPPGEPAEDFVLERFEDEERALVDPAIDRAVEALETWVEDGIEAAMSRFNG